MLYDKPAKSVAFVSFLVDDLVLLLVVAADVLGVAEALGAAGAFNVPTAEGPLRACRR